MIALLIALAALGVAFVSLFYAVPAREDRADREIQASADALPWHKPDPAADGGEW